MRFSVWVMNSDANHIVGMCFDKAFHANSPHKPRWKVVGIFHSCVTPATTKQLWEEVRSTTSKWNSVFNCRFSAINPGENKRKVIKQSMINQRVRQSTSWLWWEFYWKPTKSVFAMLWCCRKKKFIDFVEQRRPLVINDFSAEKANKPNRKSGRQTAECEGNRSLQVDWLFEILFCFSIVTRVD